ncbi:MAG: phage tail protein [Myxococcota bacterium]
MTGFVAEAMSPFPAFRFQVDFREHRLTRGEQPGDLVRLCRGSFSECTGLEATMEPKVIKEGGRNYGAAQRVGAVTFGSVVLKRGMTSNEDLWRWFKLVARGGYAYRLTADITVLGPSTSGGEPVARWVWRLRHCLPTKFKAPDLDAKGDQVAIEELQLAHEGLDLLQAPRGGST